MQTTTASNVDSDYPDDGQKLMQIRVPRELHERAKAKAKATRTPLALIVRVMLDQWVKDELKIKVAA